MAILHFMKNFNLTATQCFRERDCKGPYIWISEPLCTESAGYKSFIDNESFSGWACINTDWFGS